MISFYRRLFWRWGTVSPYTYGPVLTTTPTKNMKFEEKYPLTDQNVQRIVERGIPRVVSDLSVSLICEETFSWKINKIKKLCAVLGGRAGRGRYKPRFISPMRTMLAWEYT